jgi:hypothetical protein
MCYLTIGFGTTTTTLVLVLICVGLLEEDSGSFGSNEHASGGRTYDSEAQR